MLWEKYSDNYYFPEDPIQSLPNYENKNCRKIKYEKKKESEDRVWGERKILKIYW